MDFFVENAGGGGGLSPTEWPIKVNTEKNHSAYTYIPIYTRTGISRAEQSHKPTVYCSLFIYIYVRLIATNGLPAIHCAIGP